MEDNYNIRNVPSASVADRDSRQWNLSDIRASKNCYHLYFYLLSKSAIDWRSESKPYYYISDRYWKKTEAAQAIGCDPRTVSNNLKTLCDKGLIFRIEDMDAYRFAPLAYWVPLHWDIISLFMKLGDDVNWITMLRLYAVLGYALQHDCRKFTITDLIETLGIRNSSSTFLRIILEWFQTMGLVKFSREEIHDIRYGTYYRYTLTDVELNSTPVVRDLLKDDTSSLTNEWRIKILEANPNGA